MRSITFKLRPEYEPEAIPSFFSQLENRAEIAKAGAFQPKSKSKVVRRLCYAYVNDEADLDAVAQFVGRLPEVEVAEVPEERRLIQ